MRLSLEPQASLDQVGIVMRGAVQTKVKSQESHFDDHLRSCTLAPEQFETNGQEKIACCGNIVCCGSGLLPVCYGFAASVLGLLCLGLLWLL